MPAKLRTVFVSYSHADKGFADRLIVHLKPLEMHGKLDIWMDTRKLKPGQIFRDEIANAIEAASVIVILLSADFMASDFIMRHEYPQALARATGKGIPLIIIYASPCDIEEVELGEYQMINSSSETLQHLQENDNAKIELIMVEAKRAVRNSLKGMNDTSHSS